MGAGEEVVAVAGAECYYVLLTALLISVIVQLIAEVIKTELNLETVRITSSLEKEFSRGSNHCLVNLPLNYC